MLSIIHDKLIFVQAAKESFMREFQIRLRSVQDVQEFVALATAVPFPVQVGSDKYRANGKSFMEMFCLDLAHSLTVSLECNEAEFKLFREAASRFLAN